MPEQAGVYTYSFCDLLTNNELARIPLLNVDATKRFNETGILTAEVNPRIKQFRFGGVRSLLVPGRTALYMLRDETPVWGGILWEANWQFSNHFVPITAREFLSYFDRRRIFDQLGFVLEDQIQIAYALFAYAASKPNGDIGFIVQDNVGGNSGNPLTISYPGGPPSLISDALIQLVSSSVGFDMCVDLARDQNGRIQKFLNLSYPFRGTSPDNYSVMFEFSGPPSGNVLDYEWPSDGIVAVDAFWAVGQTPTTTNNFNETVTSVTLDATGTVVTVGIASTNGFYLNNQVDLNGVNGFNNFFSVQESILGMTVDSTGLNVTMTVTNAALFFPHSPPNSLSGLQLYLDGVTGFAGYFTNPNGYVVSAALTGPTKLQFSVGSPITGTWGGAGIVEDRATYSVNVAAIPDSSHFVFQLQTGITGVWGGSGSLVAQMSLPPQQGFFEDPNMLANGWPLLEDSQTYGMVYSVPDLNSLAEGQQISFAGPVEAPVLYIDPSRPPQFGTYIVGDTARVRITDEFFPYDPELGAGIDTLLRIVQIEIIPPQNNQRELIKLTMAPTSSAGVSIFRIRDTFSRQINLLARRIRIIEQS